MGLQSFLLTFLLPGVDPGVYAKAALTPARGTRFLKSFAPSLHGGNSWWLYQIAAAPKGPDKPRSRADSRQHPIQRKERPRPVFRLGPLWLRCSRLSSVRPWKI